MATVKVTKNGPYLASEDIKLYRGIIDKGTDGVLDIMKMEEVDTDSSVNDGYYALCRCGESENSPFCDGHHGTVGFDGTETASKKQYERRAGVQYGEGVDLLDDERCAFARFCHRKHGDVWSLVDESGNEKLKEEAIEGAQACPSGRLTARDKETKELLDSEYEEPAIFVMEDPGKEVSAGLFLRGKIELVDADGVSYPMQNRRALCRCGESRNKPFCDAMHVSVQFNAE